MTQAKIPHLCGGIFFGLLLEARKPRRKARNKLNGGTDGLTSANLFNELVYVVTGDRDPSAGNTISKCVSSYKNCTSSNGVYIPFTDPATRSAFDAAYNQKDPDIFRRMSGLIDTYLSSEKCKWLVRALIEIMQTEKLNITVAINYSDSIQVSELHNAKTIIFLPFLISVLHYVVTECPDCESGRPTFEKWYSQSRPRAEWKFNSDIGEGINPIPVSMDLSLPNISVKNNLIDDSISPSPMTDRVEQSIDNRSEREVINQHMRKLASTIATAFEERKAQIPSTENLAKALKQVVTVFEAQEHDFAEKIRKNEKEPHTSQQNESCDSIEANDNYSSAKQEQKGSTIHQTVVNQYGDHPVHIDHVDNLKI